MLTDADLARLIAASPYRLSAWWNMMNHAEQTAHLRELQAVRVVAKAAHTLIDGRRGPKQIAVSIDHLPLHEALIAYEAARG